jgi:hypothetical protein
MSNTLPTQENVNLTGVAAYADGQDIFPLSSASAAKTALALLESGASLAQMDALRLDPSLLEYAVMRAQMAHARMRSLSPDMPEIPEEAIRHGMSRALGIGINVAVMAIIGATTGHRFDRITGERPSAAVMELAEATLSRRRERERLVAWFAFAAEALDEEENPDLTLSDDYKKALTTPGYTSPRFPTNTLPDPNNRHVQREALMQRIGGRLQARFGIGNTGSGITRVDALVHNLLVGPPDETVNR